MNVSFDGIGLQTVTFKAASGVTAGIPVKISAAKTVAACEEEDVFIGVSGNVCDDGYAAVALHGFITLPYSGETAPSLGWNLLLADGDGGVIVDDSDGIRCLVTEVDTTGGKVSFFM